MAFAKIFIFLELCNLLELRRFIIRSSHGFCLGLFVIFILINIFGGNELDGQIIIHIDEELYFEIVHPEEISYTFKITSAYDFGTKFNSTIKNVPLVPARPLQLCSLAENVLELYNSIALVQRGDCSFVTKALNAEKAGAIAVVIMDSDINNDEEVISMQNDEAASENPYIPAVFIFGKDGYMILKTLAKLKLDQAIINIPINLTGVPLHKRNLPKWLVW